jgi:hypothetical protein
MDMRITASLFSPALSRLRNERQRAKRSFSGRSLAVIFPSFARLSGDFAMATVAIPPTDRQSSERKFYTRMAILLVVVTFLGFAPSFYLRGIVPEFPRPNPSLSPFVIFHGLLFTAWMAVLVAQTQLISAGRRDLHMKLGAASMFLAIALVPTMYLVGVWQVERANQPPITTPLEWTIVPIAAIPPFAYLVWQAWRRRFQAQWHKRLMLGAAILVVFGPAFGRLPLAPPIFEAMFAQMLAGMLLLFTPLFIWDRRREGKVHPATWTAFAASLFAWGVPLVLMATHSWEPIARYLPGIGA